MPESVHAHLLLAKYPEARTVKTRLVNGVPENNYAGLKDVRRATGKPLGEDDAYLLAADLYRAFLTDRFQAHGAGRYDLYLGTSQPERAEAFRTVTGPDVLYCPVRGANMGEMMFRIFQDLLRRYEKVIISGSDFPYLSESIIDRAFQRLNTHDIVLAPACDGAYNLIGMRRPHNIFTISRWSSGSELGETIKLMDSRNIPYVVLDDVRLLDIDTIEDLRILMQTLQEKEAPVTYAKLREMRAVLRILNHP